MIDIRKADSQEDAYKLSELAKKIWREHYVPIIGIDQTEYMLEKFQSQAAIWKSMNDGYIYFLAYQEGYFCGYAGVKLDEVGNTVFLSKLYVQKEYRGMGISKILMEAVYDFAKNCNGKSIWLTCNKHNCTTIDIYKKMGFVLIDELVTDIGEGYVMDDYVLEKQLK